MVSESNMNESLSPINNVLKYIALENSLKKPTILLRGYLRVLISKKQSLEYFPCAVCFSACRYLVMPAVGMRPISDRSRCHIKVCINQHGYIYYKTNISNICFFYDLVKVSSCKSHLDI